MSLNKVATVKKERFLIPEDSHVAKLYTVVDLGTQDTGFRRYKTDKEGKQLKGSDGKLIDLGPQINDQVHLTFELQDVRMDDNRPAVISPFNLKVSMWKDGSRSSTFRKILDAMLGGQEVERRVTEGDTLIALLKDCLGKACLVSVTHTESKGTVYSNFGSAVSLPSGLRKTVTPVENPLVFVPDADDAKTVASAKLPNFVLEKIAKRLVEVETVSSVSELTTTSDDESPY